MKFTVKGGNKDIQKQLTTGEYSDQVKSMPSKPINGKLKVSLVKESEKKDEVKIEEKVNIKVKVEDKKEVKEEAVKKEVICPIEIDESLIKKEEITVSDVDMFNEALQKIKDIYNNTKDTSASEIMKNSILEIFGEDSEDKAEESEVVDESVYIERLIAKLKESKRYKIGFNYKNMNYDEEYNCLIIEFIPKIVEIKDNEEDDEEDIELFEENSIDFGFIIDNLVPFMQNAGYKVIKNDDAVIYNDCKFVASKVIDINTLFQNQEGNVIVVLDDNGNYITDENSNVICIDTIDDKSIESSSIVSTEWLNNVIDTIEQLESKESEDCEECGTETSIPVGVLPPSLSVNGVPVEEDVDEDNSEEEVEGE